MHNQTVHNRAHNEMAITTAETKLEISKQQPQL